MNGDKFAKALLSLAVMSKVLRQDSLEVTARYVLERRGELTQEQVDAATAVLEGRAAMELVPGDLHARRRAAAAWFRHKDERPGLLRLDAHLGRLHGLEPGCPACGPAARPRPQVVRELH